MYNEVTNFMFYMFNVWNKQESVRIFGENLGAHIYNKWMDMRHDDLRWYGALDDECRQKLVDAANEYYNR